MMLQRTSLLKQCLTTAVMCGVVIIAGCGEQVDPRVAEFRERVMLTSLPAEPSSIAALLVAPDLASKTEVTIAGRIYGGKSNPFEQSEASFSLIELPEPGHNHDDPSDCPFCKRKLDEAAQALVQICDSDGKPLDIAADKLLGLNPNQDIAVTGHATKVGDLLIVQAAGIELLSKEKSESLARQFAEKTTTESANSESATTDSASADSVTAKPAE